MLLFAVALVLQIIVPAIAFSSVVPRQNSPVSIPISDIPPVCTANCTNTLTVFQDCFNNENATCICTQPMQVALFNCFLCLGDLSGNFSNGQDVINTLEGTCDSLSLSLSPLAFPGQTSTIPVLPTPVGTASTTGLGSSSTSSPSTTITLQQSSTSPVDTSGPTGSPNPPNSARPKMSLNISWVLVPTLFTLSLFVVQ